ncbi:hypothetical protein M501DRAFT_988420 [Patellaria atrata CBS 101060]|uniref:tRNA(Ile)-lysidine/2-thiocytidine synthase N-terminal domain-containing protein n=1 Tax=Patellaria atrata CBS 101060 TaxID=1346257 RepID=A0A9P4VVY3_9PEZI|nr:hypothetical protein M501DRAFT_988420 [Patellaria atrata CBS 101060]
MQEISDIPECNGVPMVHQIPTISSLGHEFGIADKGVQILRPLLAYSKIELQDTCRAAKMPWVEDATNADPTLTLRNAVRFILSPSKARTEAESSELLPVALRKRSLIEISKRAAEMEQRVEEKAQECFNGCKISLNISSGTLNLEVPADVFRMISSTTGKDGEHHYRGWFKVTAALLRRLVRLITPTESILLPNLVSAVPRFLPQDLLEPTEKNHTQQSQIFLVSGVQFTPLGENTWRLTARIPMENGEAPELTHSDLLQRSYHLWDGRFWILLHNVSEQLEVKIRRFRKEDAERFYACFNPKQRKTVKAILGEFCPAKGRFTLPAIVAKDEGGRERVIALPTMRIKIPQKKIPRELQNLTCSVRYKHVDLGSHDLNKCRDPSTLSPLKESPSSSLLNISVRIPSCTFKVYLSAKGAVESGAWANVFLAWERPV